MKSREHTCCFFGHRKIDVTEELVSRLEGVIEDLVIKEEINTFLFGSKSEFDGLCLNVVAELKKKYPHIIRIYVRAEFPYINEEYTKYLLKMYDETYYPKGIIKAGKAVYVKRNFEMVDKSSCCVIYYDDNYVSTKQKSGTKVAYEYAVKKGLKIYNVR